MEFNCVIGKYDNQGCLSTFVVNSCLEKMNAIFMAGITELVYGAMDSDIRGIGFDEALKPIDWVGAYHDRRISVEHKQHLRQKAIDVLKLYKEGDAPIYL